MCKFPVSVLSCWDKAGPVCQTVLPQTPRSLGLTVGSIPSPLPIPESMGWSFTGKRNQSNLFHQLRGAEVAPVYLPFTQSHGSGGALCMAVGALPGPGQGHISLFRLTGPDTALNVVALEGN